MAARRKAGSRDEAGVEMVFLSLCAYEADYGLDIVDLGRELGVHAGTVVRSDDCVAGLEEGVADGPEISHSLGVVAEPGAAVDMDDNRIGIFLFLREIDVEIMVCLAVAGIVDVGEFFGALHLGGLELETAEVLG